MIFQVTFILVMQCIGPPPRGLQLGLFNEDSPCAEDQEMTMTCKTVFLLDFVLIGSHHPLG